jgi:hypothetical protein
MVRKKIPPERWFRRLKYSPQTGLMYRSRCYRPVDDGAITTKDSYGYINVNKGGIVIKAHRVAFYMMGVDPKNNFVDHVNGDVTDNRWCNLRLVNQRQNLTNTKRHRCGHLKGTTWNKQKSKWVAQIHHHGEKVYLGQFDSQVSAHKAYNDYCEGHQI